VALGVDFDARDWGASVEDVSGRRDCKRSLFCPGIFLVCVGQQTAIESFFVIFPIPQQFFRHVYGHPSFLSHAASSVGRSDASETLKLFR
jgi:hypothetical protein